MATPIKCWEIVLGYVLGFGLITLLQSILITVYVVYGLHIMLAGSVWLVLLITLLSAVTALTLGILLSTAAHSEFQMVQFIPIVIVPQIFLSDIFDLSGSECGTKRSRTHKNKIENASNISVAARPDGTNSIRFDGMRLRLKNHTVVFTRIV